MARLEYAARRTAELRALSPLTGMWSNACCIRATWPSPEPGASRSCAWRNWIPLRVEVVLPQAAYGKVQLGTVVLVSPEGMDDKHKARVTVVDKVIDAASSTFGVRLELTNWQGRLPAGMRCSGRIPRPQAGGRLAGK